MPFQTEISIHQFIIVSSLYFFHHSSCPKDQFGTQDFTDPGLLKIRLTLTGLLSWFCLHKCFCEVKMQAILKHEFVPSATVFHKNHNGKQDSF